MKMQVRQSTSMHGNRAATDEGGLGSIELGKLVRALGLGLSSNHLNSGSIPVSE